MVGTGILSNNMRSPSPECYTTFWMMTIYSDTLHWSGITPIVLPYYRSGPHYRIWLFSKLQEVSIEHLQRARHANRGRLLLRTPGLVPQWDLQVFVCWDQSLLKLSCFRTFEFRTSLGTSVFASHLNHLISLCNAHFHWLKRSLPGKVIPACFDILSWIFL